LWRRRSAGARLCKCPADIVVAIIADGDSTDRNYQRNANF
jgi:hypothetical protein